MTELWVCFWTLVLLFLSFFNSPTTHNFIFYIKESGWLLWVSMVTEVSNRRGSQSYHSVPRPRTSWGQYTDSQEIIYAGTFILEHWEYQPSFTAVLISASFNTTNREGSKTVNKQGFRKLLWAPKESTTEFKPPQINKKHSCSLTRMLMFLIYPHSTCLPPPQFYIFIPLFPQQLWRQNHPVFFPQQSWVLGTYFKIFQRIITSTFKCGKHHVRIRIIQEQAPHVNSFKSMETQQKNPLFLKTKSCYKSDYKLWFCALSSPFLPLTSGAYQPPIQSESQSRVPNNVSWEPCPEGYG